MRWHRVARGPGDDLALIGSQFAGDRPLADDTLAAALEDLEAGLTPLQVLDRYPDCQDQLAPLVETAYALRTTRWPSMSMAGRVAGRERMHATLASQRRRKGGFLAPLWRQVGVAAALLLMGSAAFLASPLSPLDFPRKPAGAIATPTAEAPVLILPSETNPVTAPTASATPSATVTATATVPPTREAVMSAEPTETRERPAVLVPTRLAVRASATPSATRRATRAPTRTPAPSATVMPALTEKPTGTSGDVVVTPAPSATAPATVAPSATPSPVPTLIKVTRTPTLPPTDEPEPTATATVPPTATVTRTPRPTATREPTATPEPTDTPGLPRPTRTPQRTPPRPANTPTPAPSVTVQADRGVAAQVHQLLRAAGNTHGIGQELRAVLKPPPLPAGPPVRRRP